MIAKKKTAKSVPPVKLIRPNWSQVVALHRAYWAYFRKINTIGWVRSPNISPELTESIVCFCTNASLIRGRSGDIKLPDGSVGEVKATSSSAEDVSSFSPSSRFDNLYFVHMDSSSNDIYVVYDLGRNRRAIGKIKVTKTSTFNRQCKAKRRPRFSIMKEIINKNGLAPTWKVDLSKPKNVAISVISNGTASAIPDP